LLVGQLVGQLSDQLSDQLADQLVSGQPYFLLQNNLQLYFSYSRHIRLLAGPSRRKSILTNPDGKLQFEPLLPLQPAMPVLNRPIFLPNVIGLSRSQQFAPSNGRSQQFVHSTSTATFSVPSSQPNPTIEEDNSDIEL